MLSPKKQKLLNLAYSLLAPGEAYCEIGAYRGKSLIAAMHSNAPRPTFACDNFSEDSQRDFLANISRYGLASHVTFYNFDFRELFTPGHLPVPIGAYFFDGPHDEESQYLGIKLMEPYLSRSAVVIVDDWRYAEDSKSYARAGTTRAVTESNDRWELRYELPARFNGDREMWWNGVAVYSYERAARPPSPRTPFSKIRSSISSILRR